MGKLAVFESITLDGYFTDMKGDMSWAHDASKADAEWDAYVAGNAKGGGTLLFGRITYQMMESYWPTPQAAKNDPIVAQGMNTCPKVVFSKTLDKVSWENTKLVKGDMIAEIRKLKSEPGADLTILGSGKIVAQATQAHLIDEYTLIVNPVVLGRGRTLFEAVETKLPLKLTKTRAFGNGNVLLCYQPKT